MSGSALSVDKEIPRRLRVAAPFNTAVYDDINSWHPLFEPLFSVTGRLDFVEAVDPEPAEGSLEGAARDAKALSAYLNGRTLENGCVKFSDISEFVRTRGMPSQASIPRDVDIVFHHTSPVTFGQTPWMLHIETVTTLFHPFILHGSASSISLKEHPVYWIVRAMLERDEFRCLSTHMRMTEAAVKSVFSSDVISSKVRYVPLGVQFPDYAARKIDGAIERKHGAGRDVKVLFTNSWHAHPDNFYNRGGQEVVSAFLEASRKAENLSLTLLTTLPEEFRSTELYRQAAAHHGVEIIERRVSDTELLELLIEASVFVLPSAGLHSVSTLKAMGAGAVCVVSDAPGYSEFIEDGENGLVVRGIAERVYSTDPGTLWQRDDYSAMRTLNVSAAESLAGKLLNLSADPAMRKRLALKALTDAEKRSASVFRGGFEDAAEEAAEGSHGKRPCGHFEVRPAVPDPMRAARKEERTARLVGETPMYNIIRSAGGFVAVARALGRVDLFGERLGDREISPMILLGGSEEEVRKKATSSRLVLWNILMLAKGLFRSAVSGLEG